MKLQIACLPVVLLQNVVSISGFHTACMLAQHTHTHTHTHTGCVVPLFVILLSWRLTVLLPPKRENVGITPSPSSGLPLVESPSMYSSGVEPMGQQVLY